MPLPMLSGSHPGIPMSPSRPLGGRRGGVGLFTGRAMDMGFEAEFTPTVALLSKDFNTMGEDIRSFKEPLERSIRQVMAPSFQKNFDVGGRPTWPPLSEVTREFKAAEGRDRGTLIRSGTLRQVAGQLNIWHIDGQAGQAYVRQLPARAWYGQIHQGGTLGVGFESFVAGNTPGLFAAPGETPPRPWAVAQREDLDAVQKVFADWIQERLRRSGRL